MSRRVIAIMKKEVLHIIRDWRSLLIILVMPVLMIILFGYAITFEMRNIKFACIDDAKTPESRELIRGFSDNGFFLLRKTGIRRKEIGDLFMTRQAAMVLVIPRDFSLSLRGKPMTNVQIVVDASDPNVASFIHNYSNNVIRIFNEHRVVSLPVLFRVEPRIFYNPDLKSSYFFVPGLVAILLLLICALLTSITITREKETGTMEQLLVSPVRPVEILVGKVVPYIFIGFIIASLILLSAYVFFSVPVEGNLLLIAGEAAVYIFAALSFGLMVSTIAKTQQVAMLLTLLSTILPTIMLSGFIFPLASMPIILQWISYVIPATYFLVIIRGIMLKGIGLPELWTQTMILAGIGLFLIAIAVRRFRTTLEW